MSWCPENPPQHLAPDRPSGASTHAILDGGGAALGSKRQNVDILPEGQTLRRNLGLREIAADQRQAAAIYRAMTPEGQQAAGRGVQFCGWSHIKGRSIRMMRAETAAGARAWYEGTCKCKLGSVCPVCAPAKSEAQRDMLNRGLKAARRLGLKPVLVTLTVRHKRGDDLADLRARMAEAARLMKTKYTWKRLAKGPMKRGGFAQTIESTYGHQNGHHPHYHQIDLIDAETEAEAVQIVRAAMCKAWPEALAEVGLTASDAHGVDVRGGEAAGTYISKWGLEDELTRGTKKTGKSSGRFTPFEMLRLSRTADSERERQRWAAIWWEFVQAFKGAHMHRLNPAFKALALSEEPTAEGDQEQPEGREVMDFGTRHDPTWEFARARRVRMREAAEAAPLGEEEAAILAVMMDGPTDADLTRRESVSVIEDETTEGPEISDPPPLKTDMIVTSSKILHTTTYQGGENGSKGTGNHERSPVFGSGCAAGSGGESHAGPLEAGTRRWLVHDDFRHDVRMGGGAGGS